MQSIITSLYIAFAVVTIGLAIPVEASDRNPKSNETSTKPSSSQSSSMSSYLPKEEPTQRPGIRFSER
ncbi:MAG: hypothetical protein ACRCSV_00135 [Chlamydiales bacterium]